LAVVVLAAQCTERSAPALFYMNVADYLLLEVGEFLLNVAYCVAHNVQEVAFMIKINQHKQTDEK
jgi:hypothetical protein